MNKLRSAVRPIVTILFAGTFVVGFMAGRVSEDMFVAVAATVMAYWFGSRPSGK